VRAFVASLAVTAVRAGAIYASGTIQTRAGCAFVVKLTTVATVTEPAITGVGVDAVDTDAAIQARLHSGGSTVIDVLVTVHTVKARKA